jgi:hypothetical protein
MRRKASRQLLTPMSKPAAESVEILCGGSVAPGRRTRPDPQATPTDYSGSLPGAENAGCATRQIGRREDEAKTKPSEVFTGGGAAGDHEAAERGCADIGRRVSQDLQVRKVESTGLGGKGNQATVCSVGVLLSGGLSPARRNRYRGRMLLRG